MSAKKLSLKEATANFETLIARVKNREEFIDWIHDVYCENDNAKPPFVTDAIKKLRDIADHIRVKVS
ncbi:unnamed protein product [Cylicostephanus goldi]|uniref:Uncharacterized protein n=1 Tax=Cylicostephanus goldi TaxID=71465 RepID=A0A3P7N9L2_CYLGO|nr:unnamed protein product [Cylicostephanus goldi]